MTFLQLQYFRYIAEAGSITRVAETINISPTALSKSIHQLEKELDTTLFDREGRKIVLNRNGEIFLEHVREILASIETAEHRLHEAPIRRLRIRADVPFAYSSWFIIMLKKARRDLNIEIVPLNRGDAPYDLRVFDSTESIRSKRHNLLQICREDYVVALPAGHLLAGRNAIDPIELADEHFVSINYIPCEAAMTTICNEAGFTPNIEMHFDMTQVDGLHNYVREGLGCTITPECGWKLSDNMRGISLVHLTEPTVTRYLYAETEDGGAAQEDIDFVIDFMRERSTMRFER